MVRVGDLELGGWGLREQVVQAAEPAEGAGLDGNQPHSIRAFFWKGLTALQQRARLGVTAPAGSTVLAAQVLHDHVQGVAHVARMLATVYNMLLE
jgi:hypothetical protein